MLLLTDLSMCVDVCLVRWNYIFPFSLRFFCVSSFDLRGFASSLPSVTLFSKSCRYEDDDNQKTLGAAQSCVEQGARDLHLTYKRTHTYIHTQLLNTET